MPREPPKPRSRTSGLNKPQNLNEECLLAYLSHGTGEDNPEAIPPQAGEPFDLTDMSAGPVIQAKRVGANPRVNPNTLI